jgi:hypothetical protein
MKYKDGEKNSIPISRINLMQFVEKYTKLIVFLALSIR